MHGVMGKEENMEKWQEPKEWNYLKINEKNGVEDCSGSEFLSLERIEE